MTDFVVVVSESTPDLIEVISAGPQGAQGATGPKGDVGDVNPAMNTILADTQAARDAALTAKTAAQAAQAGAEAAKTSAETAQTGAVAAAATATTKAGEASSSASSASTSASTATTQAAAASTSASNASTSASTATTQAGIATTQAGAAATSASNAATSASAALSSKNAAATSETNAAASASTASTKASDANSSAANAANSASTATTQAGIATAQATAAATSSSNATGQASSAGASAAAAAASQTAAANSASSAAASQSAAAVSAASVSGAAATATAEAAEAAASAAAINATFGNAASVALQAQNAQAAASLAQGYAASASSVIQQDLSGITAQALHRSPNAITAQFIYDTSKDSDGGAWTERCQHTSWYNEALAGKWLGPQDSEFSARAVGSTLGSELVTNGDNETALYSGAGSVNGTLVRAAAPGGGLAAMFTCNAGTFSYQALYQTVPANTSVRISVRVYVPTGSLTAIQLFDAYDGSWTAATSTVKGSWVTLTATRAAKGTAWGLGIGQVAAQSLSGQVFYVDDLSVKPVTALNTASNDYFQLSTDGKFYRLWRNVLSRSNDFDNAAWTKGSASFPAGNYTAPDGTVTARKLVEDVSGAAQNHYTYITGNTVKAVPQTFSVYLKKGERTLARLVINAYSGNSLNCFFDLNAGTVGTTSVTGTATGAIGTIQDAGNGWYRCSLTGNPSTATGSAVDCQVKLATTGPTDNYIGDGTSGIYVWGAQLEYGSAATTYDAKAADGPTTEIYRGNKADFPRLAAIVAEATSVTIYDLTEPGRPMWMRFVADPSNIVRDTITCCAASNGIMVAGASTRCMTSINFVSESGFLFWTSQNFAGDYRGTIAQRNALVSYLQPSTRYGFLASTTVNAVAMTVLPDAPTDPATGLRVPTIAVATGGGVSVIKHNGTVVNSSSTVGYQTIEIKGTTLFVNDLVRYPALATNIGGLGPSFALSLYGTYGQAGAWTNTLAKMIAGNRNQQYGFLNYLANRVFGGRPRESALAAGLGFTIANTYNTGWMTGDIRRCYLSDTTVGSLTGPELVTNGTFDTDTTGWGASNCTIAVEAGRLKITNLTTSPVIVYSSVGNGATVAGKTYRVRYTAEINDSSGATDAIRVSAPSGSWATSNISPANGLVTRDVVVTSTSSQPNIEIVVYGAADTIAYIDNISIREVDADRSYKAQGATITGTLTRAQLASGTSLVGYSGFSASNYLREPYSADLDFGTGEFTASAWVNIPATLPDASFPVGSEIFSDPGFDTPASWTASAGTVSVTGSSAVWASAASLVNIRPSPEFLPTASVWYRCQFNITAISSGALRIANEAGATLSADFTTTGVKTVYFQAPSASSVLLRAVGTTTATVSEFSMRTVGPAIIADRAFSSGPRIRLGVTGTGLLTAEAFDGTTTRTVTTTAAYNTATWLKAEANYTTDGSLTIRVNGREVAATRGNPLLNMSGKYNLIQYSEDLSNVYWVKYVTTVTGTNTISFPSQYSGVRTTLSLTAGVTYTLTLTASVASGTRQFYVTDFTTNTLYGNYTATSTPTVFTVTFTAAAGAGSLMVIQDRNASGFVDATVTKIQLEINSVARPYQRVGAATDFDFQAPLTIGNSYAADAPFPGTIALLKLGATVPTQEQATFMYEQEKQLFRAGALSVLPDSGAVVDMAYDDATDRWVAVSATNESYWTGLIRNTVTPVPAGSYTRIVATSGIELAARSTTNPGVDVTIPAYGLREELVKRAEAAARLSKELATFDYVGGFTGNTTSGSTAIASVSTITYPASYIGARISGSGIPTNATIVAVSGTTIYISAAATATATGVSITFLDFELPVGMEAKTVMSAGSVKQEGSTKDYTRLYDGFIETIRFGTAPGATTWVQIQAQRITLQ